jgi:hypothetical protein
MDLILELETMAANVVDDPTSDPDSEPDVSTRWQPLFSYTLTEARERVKTHRSNLSRERVSDAHWDIMRSAREAEGYDREAYEYSLSLGKGAGVSPQATNMPPTTEGASPIQSTFLLKLAGPLDTAAKAQEAAGLPSCPAVLTGNSDSGDATFCRVNAATRRAILDRLSLSHNAFRPTFILI